MAVVTATVLAAAGLAVAAGGAATGIIQGANAKAEAEDAAAKAAQSLSQMQEADKFKNLQVPTLGLEMAQQNVQARQAQQLQGLQDIGASGVLGGLTALNQQGQAEDLALSAQAQEAQYARDFAQAQNAQSVEQRNLSRQAGLEQQRLTGAQAAAAAGQQQINSGIQGLAQIGGEVMAQGLANRPLFEQQAAQGLNRNGTLTGAKIQSNAQQAFAPQLASMKPNVTMTQVTPTRMGGYQTQYDDFLKLQGLRGAQGQFDAQYQWSPGLGWAQ
jgi:hypothetical protein